MQLNLQTGDIILINGKSLKAKIIKFLTKSKFSHVEVAISNWGNFELVGADWIGIRGTDFNHILKGKYIAVLRHKKWLTIPFNFAYESAMASRINSKKGDKYDYISLLYQLYKVIFHRWIGKKKNADDKFYCSEFAAWVNELKKYWKLTPEDLYKHKDLFIVWEGEYV